MPFVLVARRDGARYTLPVVVQPCKRDHAGVEMQALMLLVDTGASCTSFSQATFPGLRVARAGYSEIADGRLIASGWARMHLIFPSARDVKQDIVTVRAIINLDASAAAEGLLGMDLIQELVVKGEHATLTLGARGSAQTSAALAEIVEELRCDCLPTLRSALERTSLR